MDARTWMLVLGLSLGACAAPASSSSTSGTATPQKDNGTSNSPETAATAAARGQTFQTSITPVLAIMGGYTSCGDNGDPSTQQLASFYTTVHGAMASTSGKTTPFVLTCYTEDASQVQYLLSTSPNLATSSGSVNQMIQDLGAMLATYTNPVLYIVGHSYGGWTAMDTVLNLNLSQAGNTKIGALVTLDPISMVNCTPVNFIVSNLGGGSDPGCLEAPTDFGTQKLATIASRASTWTNYYELDDAILHSGPISDASNIQETYAVGGFTAHNAFTQDASIAAQVSAMVDSSLAALGD